MARVEWTLGALEDLEQILDHMMRHSVNDAAAKVLKIVEALEILQQTPLIGKSVQHGRRELLVGRRRSTYTARYRYMEDIDMVFILSVRSQRQADKP
jgi:plasmid stabilization system protein ParE